jgi:hypothetical protein
LPFYWVLNISIELAISRALGAGLFIDEFVQRTKATLDSMGAEP